MPTPVFKALVAIAGLAVLAACAGTPKSNDSMADSQAQQQAKPPSDTTTPATTAPATSQDKPPQRKQYKGKTTFPVTPEATRGSAFLTPLPEEYLDVTAHLPEGFVIRLPFQGSFKVSTGYGYESNAWTHQTIGNAQSANDFFALDFDMPVGTTVLAAAPGRVVTSEDRTTSDSYGNYVVIDHGNGLHTIYAHLSKREFDVDHGTPEIHVQAGQKIGDSGKSGVRWPHLHFAVHQNATLSHSGCDVGGKAVVPEPLGGYYGIRAGHVLEAQE